MSEPRRLRDWQADLVSRIKARDERAVMVQASTGSGKTVMAAALAAGKASEDRNASIGWCAHNRRLRRQAIRELKLAGLECADWREMPSRKREWRPGVVSVFGPAMKIPDPPAGSWLVVDEAHRSASPRCASLIEEHPWGKVIGLSATPARYGWPERISQSHRKLQNLWDAIECGPELHELVKSGNIAEPMLRRIDAEGDETLLRHNSMQPDGYTQESVAAWESSLSVDLAVAQLLAAEQKPTIVFAATTQGARLIHSKLPACRLILQDTPDAERERSMQDLEDGKATYIVNVQVMLEGVDLPSVQRVVLLRPSRSRVLLSQAVGRGTRPPGMCEVWDAAGSYSRLGSHPLDSLPWERVLDEEAPGQASTGSAGSPAECACGTATSPASGRRLCLGCGAEVLRTCVACGTRLRGNESWAHRRCEPCATAERKHHLREAAKTGTKPTRDRDSEDDVRRRWAARLLERRNARVADLEEENKRLAAKLADAENARSRLRNELDALRAKPQATPPVPDPIRIDWSASEEETVRLDEEPEHRESVDRGKFGPHGVICPPPIKLPGGKNVFVWIVERDASKTGDRSDRIERVTARGKTSWMTEAMCVMSDWQGSHWCKRSEAVKIWKAGIDAMSDANEGSGNGRAVAVAESLVLRAASVARARRGSSASA